MHGEHKDAYTASQSDGALPNRGSTWSHVSCDPRINGFDLDMERAVRFVKSEGWMEI